MSIYSLGIPSQQTGQNLWGAGTQTTSDGYWVPNGQGGYNLQPFGALPPTAGGSPTDPMAAGGGMYGSAYGATGSPGYTDGSGGATTAPASTAPGNVYSKPVSTSSYGNPQVAPPPGMVYNQSIANLPGGGYNNPNNPYANGQIDPMFGTGYVDPVMQSMLQNGGSYAANQNSLAGNPMNPGNMTQADVTSLMNYLGPLMTQQAPAAPALPQGTSSAPTGSDPLTAMLMQAFGASGPPLIDYGMGAATPTNPTPSTGATATGALPWNETFYGGNPYGESFNPQNPQQSSSAIQWEMGADGGLHRVTPLNPIYTNQPATGQTATPPAPQTVNFPLPSGGSSGGTLGIPLPQPTPLPPLPATPPASAPTAPWNQTGQPILLGGTPQSAAQTTPQPTWNGVATNYNGVPQGVQAVANSGVFGSTSVIPAEYQAMMEQGLASNPTLAQQYNQPSAPAATQQQATGGGGFNFGGTQTAGGTLATTPSGTQAGSSGFSGSLLSLLGGLPQPPDLSMQMPTIGTDGAFANMPGGVPTRLNPAPIINDQQMNQLINQATANNARQAATSAEQAREAMTGNGFSAASGALGDVNRLLDAQRMNADTQAYSQIPLQTAQLNNQAMNQAMGLNLQGQQNAITSFNSLSDFLKNQGALGAQQYGLGIQGYNAFQNALQGMLGLGNQQQQNQIAQYGQDLNAYNLQNQAQNNYLQALLSSGQLALQGNNSYNQNLTSLLSVLNQAQGNQNQELATLLGALGGLM